MRILIIVDKKNKNYIGGGDARKCCRRQVKVLFGIFIT